MEYITTHIDAIEYAEYSELKARGIRCTINQGLNDFGLQERIILCDDGTQWDYIPEDELYQQRLTNLIRLS